MEAGRRPREPAQRESRAEAGRDARGPFVEAEGAESQRGSPIDQRRLVVVAETGFARFPPVAARPGHGHGHVGVTPFVGFVQAARAEAKHEQHA